MSHMMVMVITPHRPTPEQLAAAMQPYHEFECTGVDDKYVVDVDETEEARRQYATDTDYMMVAADGAMRGAFEPEFYREFTAEELKKHGGGRGPLGSGAGGGISWSSRDWEDGQGYRAKVHYTPPGSEQRSVPVNQLRDFRSWLQDYYDRKEVGPQEQPDLQKDHKYGYTRVGLTGEVLATYKRTNPNAEWDWYVVGGRYTGRLLLRPGSRHHATLYQKPDFSSLFGNPPAEPDPLPNGATDQALVADLDLEGMRAKGRAEGQQLWDKVHAAAGSLPPPQPFSEVLAAHPGQRDVARRAYWAQPAVAALQQALPDYWDLEEPLAALTQTRQQAGELAADQAVSCFAVLHNGQWSQRGRMGWWGTVSNERDRAEWGRQCAALLAGLPPESCVTVVDCHI